MSSVKGVVNRNAKTSGKNSTTNTALQNADTKDAVQNKTHEKEKLQVNLICSICQYGAFVCTFLNIKLI